MSATSGETHREQEQCEECGDGEGEPTKVQAQAAQHRQLNTRDTRDTQGTQDMQGTAQNQQQAGRQERERERESREVGEDKESGRET